MKIRSTSELIQILDNDLSWRRLDLLYIKRSVTNSKGITKNSAIRAAIPILYAHWEGFIKVSAAAYATYLSKKRYKFKDLKMSYSGLQAKQHIDKISDIKSKIFATSLSLIEIYGIEEERVNISLNEYIDRVGNLNHDMFIQIINFFSIEKASYENFKALIDVSLLSNRNKIAHGEYLDIDEDRYESLHNDIIALIEKFKSDIENLAISESYLRTIPI